MSNTRKSLIPEGTVASPGRSLVESIIDRDRAQTGRARPADEPSETGGEAAGNTASNTTSNTASNTADNMAANTSGNSARPSRRASRQVDAGAAPDAADAADIPPPAPGASAVVGSRRRIPMTTITVRIPTEMNQWIADLVHERSADGITKQDVIVSALRLLRDHEERRRTAAD